MDNHHRISGPCSRKRKLRLKVCSFFFFEVINTYCCKSPKIYMTLFLFSVLLSAEKDNSPQRKKEKLIPSSGNCLLVHQRRTMKKSALTLVLRTFAGCWRDSTRWKRKGKMSRQRFVTITHNFQFWKPDPVLNKNNLLCLFLSDFKEQLSTSLYSTVVSSG